jgi:phosphoserine phosphatase RsbU/P
VETRAGCIILIGPDGSSRSMLQQRLEALGGQVNLGDAQNKCFEMVKNLKPDLIFVEVGLDTELPSSFADLIGKIKADPMFKGIPVIAYGPPEEMHQIRQAVEAGVEDYLLTPISATLIKVLYNDYIEISRQRQNEYNRSVREGFLKIERDVEIARQIQLDFLPNELPEPDLWDIAARFHPARQVAGDWYDAFYLSNKRRIGFIVGDVCDKGVGSALFMALFRSLIRAFAQQNLSLRWMDTRTDDWLSAEPEARRKSLPSTGTTAVKNDI